VRKLLNRVDRLAAAGALGPETVAMAQETERRPIGLAAQGRKPRLDGLPAHQMVGCTRCHPDTAREIRELMHMDRRSSQMRG
jgi:hypothetical protein